MSKPTILYHESKEEIRELWALLLKRAAEVAGDVIGNMALEEFQKEKEKEQMPDISGAKSTT